MANEYLKRTPTSTGNRKVFTWSSWLKKDEINAPARLIGNYSAGTTQSSIQFGYRNSVSTDGAIRLFNIISGTTDALFEFDPLFRDYSSWFHLLLSVDTTLSNADDRIIFYINGVRQEPLASTYVASGQNSEFSFNTPLSTNGSPTIGSAGGNGEYWEGEICDVFWVDGQALTPEVFGFYKDGNGYISAGSTQATDFRNGQWVPRTPREIKNLINDNGGFGVNGFYLPMNDSSNFGADFHTTPNSIITLKGENLPQPRNGAPDTTDAYVSQLREDPYAANLVLAVPGISTATGPNLVTNGNFDSNIGGWVADSGATLSHSSGSLRITVSSTAGARQSFAVESGKRYTLSFRVRTDGTNFANFAVDLGSTINYVGNESSTNWVTYSESFVANSSTAELRPYKALGGWAEFDDIVFKQEDAPLDYSADIKGSGTNKTLTANGNAGVGYEIPSYYGSALSFDGTDDYFSTPNVSDFQFGTGDFTIEAWAYSFSGTWSLIMAQGTTGDAGRTLFGVSNTGQLVIQTGDQSIASSAGVVTSEQWNHCAVVRENGVGTLYLNGVAVGINTVYTNSIQNTTLYVGKDVGWTNTSAKMYLQDLRVYKGVAKYKGGFDVPKPYTPVGIESWRAVSDTCQNNFATWNPLDRQNNTGTPTNGNLTTGNEVGNYSIRATIAVSTGKWYWEFTPTSTIQNHHGIVGTEAYIGSNYLGQTLDSWGMYDNNGNKRNNGSFETYGSAFSAYDVGMVALDKINGKIWWGKNGYWFTDGDPASGTNPAFANINTVVGTEGYVSPSQLQYRSCSYNFGQNPTFSGNITAGTYTDSNGKGLFKYQPPEGFLALCEDNLPTPAIKDPGEHFKTVLYTGDGNSGKSVDGVGFQPDFVWAKQRDEVRYNSIYDSVRGPDLLLRSDNTAGDVDAAGTGLLSFDTDGFSVGIDNGINKSGNPFVAWCWKAGGPAVTNTDGSITSQVSANQTAGFSIVTATMVSGVKTIGHGLEKTPKFIITKQTNGTTGWYCYHSALGATKNIRLDLSNVEATSSSIWNDTEPTSSVFTMGSGFGNSESYVAYCWSEIEGFSKFGSYTGNGDADGPFVYCGFKPAFLLLKIASPAGQERDWHIYDSARNSTNPVGLNLRPSTTSSEINEPGIDFLSNGFKIRENYVFSNYSTGTIIFAAFAESPFKYANSK